VACETESPGDELVCRLEKHAADIEAGLHKFSEARAALVDNARLCLDTLDRDTDEALALLETHERKWTDEVRLLERSRLEALDRAEGMSPGDAEGVLPPTRVSITPFGKAIEDALTATRFVRFDLHDGTVTCKGLGVQFLHSGTVASNVIRITATEADGLLAEWIAPENVWLDIATVPYVPVEKTVVRTGRAGVLQAMYRFTGAGVQNARVSVSCAGQPVQTFNVRGCGLHGTWTALSGGPLSAQLEGITVARDDSAVMGLHGLKSLLEGGCTAVMRGLGGFQGTADTVHPLPLPVRELAWADGNAILADLGDQLGTLQLLDSISGPLRTTFSVGAQCQCFDSRGGLLVVGLHLDKDSATFHESLVLFNMESGAELARLGKTLWGVTCVKLSKDVASVVVGCIQNRKRSLWVVSLDGKQQYQIFHGSRASRMPEWLFSLTPSGDIMYLERDAKRPGVHVVAFPSGVPYTSIPLPMHLHGPLVSAVSDSRAYFSGPDLPVYVLQ